MVRKHMWCFNPEWLKSLNINETWFVDQHMANFDRCFSYTWIHTCICSLLLWGRVLYIPNDTSALIVLFRLSTSLLIFSPRDLLVTERGELNSSIMIVDLSLFFLYFCQIFIYIFWNHVIECTITYNYYIIPPLFISINILHLKVYFARCWYNDTGFLLPRAFMVLIFMSLTHNFFLFLERVSYK